MILDCYLPVDLRAKIHVTNKFIPCRSYKNASYGQLIITNSQGVYDYFEQDAAYSSDVVELFHIACEMQNDPKTKDIILRQMNNVKQNHTYVSRISDIIECLKI